MPYCPKCRDEFQDWVNTCPDCRVVLVSDLRTPPKTSKAAKVKRESLVHVANAPNEPIARMWMESLENNGIRSTMKGGAFKPEMGSDSPFLPCEIYVLESDAPRARRILDGLPDSERPS
jgi:Putative prokaryotic signal transducing protein